MLKYFAAAGLAFVCFLSGCASSGESVVADSVQKVDLKAEALENVSISSGSGMFHIYPAEDGVPYVHMQTKIRGLHLGPTPSLIVEETGNSTDIRTSGGGWITLGSIQTEINLYLPENTVRELRVSIGSGSFYCGEMELESLDFQLSSGNADLNFITADTMDFRVASGYLYLSDAEAKNMNLNLSSGNMDIKTFGDPTALKASVSSGFLSFDGGISQGELKCASGSLYAASPILPDKLDCTISSGDVRLELPGEEAEDAGFTISYKTSSGDFYNEFPHLDNEKNNKQVTGKGEKEYNFKIASGSASLGSYMGE